MLLAYGMIQFQATTLLASKGAELTALLLNYSINDDICSSVTLRDFLLNYCTP